MKHRLLLAVAVISVLPFSGCANMTTQQKAAATSAMDTTVNITQNVFDTVVRVISARAQSGDDLNTKANLVDSAAGGLRSLETKSGGILSAELVADTLRQFTDPSVVHWSDFADSIAAALIKDPAPTNQKLEAAAAALNSAAADQRTLASAMAANADAAAILPSDSQP